MRRVLVVQPSLQPPGGGNGVAAWMVQALAPTNRVTVLSWQPVDVAPINRFFGTSLRPSDFDTLVVPRRWTLAPDHLPVPAALLRSALLMRYTRRVERCLRRIVGAHNETDYGRRGIQYVHYPTYLRPRPARGLSLVPPLAVAPRHLLPRRRSHCGFLARTHEAESDAGQFALDRRARPAISRRRRADALSTGDRSGDAKALGRSAARHSSRSAGFRPRRITSDRCESWRKVRRARARRDAHDCRHVGPPGPSAI